MTRKQQNHPRFLGLGPARPAVLCAYALALVGCSGYSNKPIYPGHVRTVCLEVFDNRTFWRDIEFALTDALAKQIETQTPYKLVSSQDRADTVLSGQILTVTQSALSTEREIGRPIEKEVQVKAVVRWKNLKTGELLLDSKPIVGAAGYSEFMGQAVGYGSTLAANRLAEKIVESMQSAW